jgi:hypothetical protein
VIDPLRLLERVHGHVGWLTAALLVHPALVLPRRAHVTVALATASATLSAALGVGVYGPYRESLRAAIFAESARIGWLFERKEHLAFGAVVFAWIGAIAYAAGQRASSDRLTKLARRAFLISAALALLVAALGTYVASFRSF